MKKAERAPWLTIGDGAWVLCSWCRYVEAGYGDELYCGHPLEVIREHCCEIMDGSSCDCWGFRPQLGLTLGEAERLAAKEGDGDDE